MIRNIVYAVLHIPTAEYVTLKHRGNIALFEDIAAANKMIEIMTSDISFYWGAPRLDYEIGKVSLSEFEIPPYMEEFDIISMPVEVLNEQALQHILKIPEYAF